MAFKNRMWIGQDEEKLYKKARKIHLTSYAWRRAELRRPLVGRVGPTEGSISGYTFIGGCLLTPLRRKWRWALSSLGRDHHPIRAVEAFVKEWILRT